MKRFALLFAVIIMLLSACASAPNEQAPSRNPQSDYANQSEKKLYFHGSQPDVYNELVATEEKLPDDFVTWSNISGFANGFSGLLFIEHRYDQYSYFFNDESGASFSLTISHTHEKLNECNDPVVSITPEMTSMRNRSSVGYSVIKRDIFEYRYSSTGKLTEIFWVYNGIEFALNERFWEYPENVNDTLIGRLLSTSDNVANAAFEEIKQHLATE